MAESSNRDTSQGKDPRHQAALDRFHLAVDVWRDQREQELQALKFQSEKGGMWPDDVKVQRAGIPANSGTGQPAIPARPMLEIRTLDQPIAQVVNQARQSELAINIVARGSEASKEVAEVFEGLIRKIQVDSHAQSAYLWAYQRAVIAGFGAFRINKKAADDDTPEDNDQDITIERILNQASVYLDPFAQDSEWRDGRWAFITEDIPADRYPSKYSESKLAKGEDDATFTALGDDLKNWVIGEGAGKCYRVAEYWFVEGEGPTQTVHWALMNGIEFIEPPQEWDGPDIPIVPVLGNESNINGKRRFEGMVTPAMDPCRMLNYMVSGAAEQIGLTTKPKWIGYAGQFEGLPGWDESNVRNVSKLEAHPVLDETGNQVLPLPRFDVAEAPIQAMSGMIAMFTNFIRSITGVPDAALGHVNPNDKSGKAIQALQQASEQGTSNFLDNLARSIKRGGEIDVNLIPKVYDRSARVIQILAPDGKQASKMLGQPFLQGPQGPQAAQPGQVGPKGEAPQHIDLAKGKYAVVVEVKKNFNTRQAENREMMLNFSAIDPNLFPRFADLVAKTLPDGDAIAERVKPPGIDDQTNLPPAIQQQMGQMQQELQQAKQIIATKQAEKQVDLEIAKMNNESRERIAAMSAQAQLVATEAKINSSDSQALLKAEFEALGLKLSEHMKAALAALDRDHQGTIEAHTAAHEAGMMAEQHAQAKMLADQQQTHEAAMGIQGHAQALEQGDQGHQQNLEAQEAASSAQVEA